MSELQKFNRGIRKWIFLALIVATCSSIHAQKITNTVNEITLDHEVRTALSNAVKFFQDQSAKDPEGWVVPPTRKRKVVDHEIVIHRYREVVREVPVYKYEYETYEILEKVRIGVGTDAVDTFRKVQKRRVVSRKQTGTKKIKRLTRDPEGPIEREHRIPKYGPGGPDVWARYAIGDNALALYALRRSGASMEDPAVSRLSSALSSFISNYGYPDETWDLAWLTAAYATLPYEGHRQETLALASKLLDGQIRDGDAAGLWGPVAINTALLAEQALQVEQLSKKLQEAKIAAAKEKRKERALKRAEETYRKALHEIVRVATFGMSGPQIEYSLTMKTEVGSSVVLAGLTDYIYNQRSADLDSTSLALYALGQAADNDRFPKNLWRPESSELKAETPSKLLNNSLAILGEKLVKDLNWDEMNHFQAVKDFHKITIFPGLPGEEVAFPKLPSGKSLLTTAQGFSAMAKAAQLADSDQLKTKYHKHLEKGTGLFREAAEDALANWPQAEPQSAKSPPFDLLLYLSEVTRESNSSREDRRDLWPPLASKLLGMRASDGSWKIKGPGRKYHLPTSLLARLEVMPPPAKKNVIEYGKPHAFRGYHNIADRLKDDRKLPPVIEDIVPTALAMVFLAENVRPPVIGECLWNSKTDESNLIPMVIPVMRKQKGFPFRYSAVTRSIETRQLAELPALLIKGTGSFKPDLFEQSVLEEYLKSGGLVLFEAMADREGMSFLSDAEQTVKALLPQNSTFEDIAKDKDLMGTLAGKVQIQASKRENGSLAAAFLPVLTKSGTKGLPQSIAARALYNMMLQKISPETLEENYPISLPHGEDPKTGD